MSVSHVIYGLQITSNLSIPGIPTTENDPSVCTLRLHLKEPPGFPCNHDAPTDFFYSSQEPGSTEQPSLRVGMVEGGHFYIFVYRDGVRFAIDGLGSEIWADFPDRYSLEDACTYLLGPILGFVLRLRGTTCLHASGIAVSDYAIALAGVRGSGKSTLAAAFARSGFPVFSDDVVALTEERGQFVVQPGYPRVNLWPDSVRALFGSETALPRITPTWDKRYLPLNQADCRFASDPMPLRAIYVLSAREGELAKPILEVVSGNDAFMMLVANAYMNEFLDSNMRSRDFATIAHIIRATPVRRVRPTANPWAVMSLCESIANDISRLTGPNEPLAASSYR